MGEKLTEKEITKYLGWCKYSMCFCCESMSLIRDTSRNRDCLLVAAPLGKMSFPLPGTTYCINPQGGVTFTTEW